MPEANLVERIKKVDKRQLFLLFMVFALAFGVRAHLFRYEYVFGFDSYYHARMVSEILQNGSLPEVDPSAYYFFEAGGASVAKSHFFWHFTGTIYNIATFGRGYDKALWIMFVKVLPALFGALTCVAMFFFGKELYNKKAGYAMALIASVIPSYVYRTLAGFFEEDCLGFLWLVIGMVFFARAVKDPVFNKKGIINAILGGFFFGLMAITWGMFLLIPLVLLLYLVFASINVYTKMGLKRLFDFAKLFVVSFGVFFLITTFFYGLTWVNGMIGYASQSVSKAMAAFSLPEAMGVPLLMTAFVLFAGFIAYLAYSNRSEEKRESGAKTINIIAMILLYCTVIVMAVTFLTIPVLFQETSVLGQTVGEENTGKQFFGIKYNALIVFPALALLLIPIRVFRERKEHISLIVFFWVFITWFMAWYKLKFTYTFGLPIAAAVGFVATEMFYYLRERTKLERGLIAMSLGFMLLIGIASATIFVPDKFPHIEEGNPNWKEALHWMQNPENVPEDAKMFNWWDHGHWISFVGERAVSADNRNMSGESNRDFSLFVITTDLNEAIRIAGEYDFDYVIFASDMFLKVSSFGNYAYDTMNSGDPRIVKFLIAPHAAMPCGETETEYVCGSNRFQKQQMVGIPVKWTTTSNQVFTAENGLTVPLYIYRAEDNSELYIINPAINESMLGRLWFHEDEAMRYFEEVYGERGIRIFRFRKEALAGS